MGGKLSVYTHTHTHTQRKSLRALVSESETVRETQQEEQFEIERDT